MKKHLIRIIRDVEYIIVLYHCTYLGFSLPLLLAKYQQLIQDKGIVDDPIQRQLLTTLQTGYDQLTHKKNLWQRIVNKNNSIKGFYLWGGVGIGKTFVMDLFYDALPFPEKMRHQFHRFMQNVQVGLRAYQGIQNPLESLKIH